MELDITTIKPDKFVPFIHRQIELYGQNSALPGGTKRSSISYTDIPVGLAIPHSTAGTPLLSQKTSQDFNLQPPADENSPIQSPLSRIPFDWDVIDVDSDSSATSSETHIINESQPSTPCIPSPLSDLLDFSMPLYQQRIIHINIPDRLLSEPPQRRRRTANE